MQVTSLQKGSSSVLLAILSARLEDWVTGRPGNWLTNLISELILISILIGELVNWWIGELINWSIG